MYIFNCLHDFEWTNIRILVLRIVGNIICHFKFPIEGMDCNLNMFLPNVSTCKVALFLPWMCSILVLLNCYCCAAWLWTFVLSKMHATSRSQLCDNMCVPGSQALEGGESYWVCALWLQGLCKWRLIFFSLITTTDAWRLCSYTWVVIW